MEKAGECQLLGHGIAADHVTGFEDQARIACFCQVSGCNQAVMPASGYNDIKLIHHLRLQSRGNATGPVILSA